MTGYRRGGSYVEFRRTSTPPWGSSRIEISRESTGNRFDSRWSGVVVEAVAATVGQIGMYTSVARRTPSRMGTITSMRHSTSKSGSDDGEVVEEDASVGTDADLVRPKTMIFDLVWGGRMADQTAEIFASRSLSTKI
jgi:hypothetical protein